MLSDLFSDRLRLVICGTAAGHRSAKLGLYYAGRGNRFWDILASTGLTPKRLAPNDYRTLITYGIGLTDIAKGQAGNDVDIQFRAADAQTLRAKILDRHPQVFCFNGKRAAQEFYRTKAIGYGLQPDPIGNATLFVAPSTSGAARGSWDETHWFALAAHLHRLDAA